jgi:hypothetical protein
VTFGHIIIALTIQALVGLLTSNWWAGAAWGAGFYLGRELTQAEYRWIETFGAGRRANMPWWGAFDPRVWHKFDAWADWVGPAVAVAIVAGVVA